MEEAKRTLNHWLARRKLIKCVSSTGTTHDYHLIEGGRVVAQISFHANGEVARWVRCDGYGASMMHSKATYWDKDGALTRVCDYRYGKREGLDLYYKNGLMYNATTYRKGKKHGLAWDGDAMVLYHRGKAVVPAWSQDRLTHCATSSLYDSLRQMLSAGAVDNGEALAAAAYEGHTAILSLLMDRQAYGQKEVIEAWKQALGNGHTEATHHLRAYLLLSEEPLDHALRTQNLAEADELFRLGFNPTERYVLAAVCRGHVETVRWCLLCVPTLRTHDAWNYALIAEQYECARLLEPGYVRVLRAVRAYFLG